jgi:hypothetical protein
MLGILASSDDGSTSHYARGLLLATLPLLLMQAIGTFARSEPDLLPAKERKVKYGNCVILNLKLSLRAPIFFKHADSH